MSTPGIESSSIFAAAAGESSDKGETRTRLAALAAQFEAMLLVQMLRDMRASTTWDETAKSDGLGLENFQQTFDLELAGYLAKSKGFGLTEQLLRTLEKTIGLAGDSRSTTDVLGGVKDSVSGAGGKYANARRGWNGLVLDMPADGNSGAQWRGFNTERASAGGDPMSTKDAWYRWTRSVSFNPAGKSKQEIEAFMRSHIQDAREYGLNILDVRGDQMLIEHWHRPGGEWVDIVANAGSSDPSEVAWHWLPQEDFVGPELAGSGELGRALSELRSMSGGEEAAKALMADGLLGDNLLSAVRAETAAIASGRGPSRTTTLAARTDAPADVPTLQAPAGPVTSAFGWRRDPITGALRFHQGIDLRAAFGEAVTAAAAGRVVFSGEQGGYGTTVVIEHDNGIQTRYAHLSSALVRAGEIVKAGDILGRAGSSGRSTGPHLHFEVTVDGRPADPSTFGFKDTTRVADSTRGDTGDAREQRDGDQD
jgi:murein DD-endopeptidase MepM/ murein hydrolase activator NlpD/Rod binding domain-containing protein